ncbi:hypothetical protein DIPPA_31765 [Diplonema papillatum]|nr:hypothetical protein DIPPA_31765 [Diplonema papillatum]
MPAFEKLVFLLASFIALADAQMYNTTTTSSNAAYQIGIWSGIVLLLALMMSIKMVCVAPVTVGRVSITDRSYLLPDSCCLIPDRYYPVSPDCCCLT